MIKLLDARLAPIHHELGPPARADARVVLLDTIRGIRSLLGLTFASEIGDVARFGSPHKLIGYAGLAPKINQSGDRSRTGQQPFKPAAPRRPDPASASSRGFLAA